ncbi:hypothetical protein [Luteolibacter marinus]|uniref:hypothetical protein n=1 Tax=Luteolibacter marinus TaxID=2776705 RepID=UPI0018663B77|nr:hypothetical protein [Luteolibacter marinus]
MRSLIFSAGALVAALGFIAFHQSRDPNLLQGGLTLGGGWIICGLFSLRSKWHGIVGAGALAFLGALRSLPSVTSVASGDPTARFNVLAGLICLVVLIAVVHALLAERRQRSIDKLKNGEDPGP